MKKYIITSAVLLATVVPAITFAATSSSGENNSGVITRTFKNFSKDHKREIPQAAQDALTAAGIALPTEAEKTAQKEARAKVEAAMKALTDDDRAALQVIREEAKKKEREYLRSKGVPLPSEDEIAAAKAKKDAIQKALKDAGITQGKMGKMEGKGHGRMGGMKKMHQENDE